MELTKALYEYRTKHFVPWHKALWLYNKNKNVKLQYVRKRDWGKYKTSNTLFIFGSGPSINEITPKQWDIINRHDSFGTNFAFLTNFPMTYFYLGYEPSSNQILSESFTYNYRKSYENTLWFVPFKFIYRLYHPKIVPTFYPPNTKLALFKYPEAINFEKSRPFLKTDFSKSLIYRGSIGVVMHLSDIFKYKNIVLLGIDLHTYKHFYDDFEIMKKEREETYKDMKDDQNIDDLLPNKGTKIKPMIEYYFSLNDLYFKPNGINLYVGNNNNLLFPKIPMFPEFS